MQLKSLNVFFFFFLLFAVGSAVFFIFQPFLTAIVAAAILSALFRKPYHSLMKWLPGHSPSLSALLTCLLVILIIVTPLFLILSLAIGEAGNLYHSLGQEATLQMLIERSINSIRHLPYSDVFFQEETLNREQILNEIKTLSQHAIGLLQTAYQSVSQFFFWVFVMFFTLYYFLIDGKKVLHSLMQLSPLRDAHDRLLVEKFVSISRATLKGTIVIGIIQGFIGGFMFWIVGVPSPAIWGLVMVLFSIIPMVGSAIIWVPAAVIMFLLGQIWQPIFILAVGFGVISVIDNVFRPKLVGKDTQMHPLLVFFASLGGIITFGLAGFIIGPIIISLFMALGEIYSIEFRGQLKEYNE